MLKPCLHICMYMCIRPGLCYACMNVHAFVSLCHIFQVCKVVPKPTKAAIRFEDYHEDGLCQQRPSRTGCSRSSYSKKHQAWQNSESQVTVKSLTRARKASVTGLILVLLLLYCFDEWWSLYIYRDYKVLEFCWRWHFFAGNTAMELVIFCYTAWTLNSDQPYLVYVIM